MVNNTNSSILLPTETWREIFHLLERPDLGCSISLVNFYFHQIAYPIMHVEKPRHLNELQILRDKEALEKYTIISLFGTHINSCIDLNMDPPPNIIGIKTLIIYYINADVANLLAYFCRHQILVQTVKFFDDREKCMQKLSQLYPEFFNGNFFRQLSIHFHIRVNLEEKKCIELAMPRKIFAHPALLNFPQTLWILIGEKTYRVGPLVHWLHWKCIGIKYPNRLLIITLCGDYCRIFVQNLISAIIQRFITAKKICPFRIRCLTIYDDWGDLLAQRARNNGIGEQLYFADSYYDERTKMMTYEICRGISS